VNAPPLRRTEGWFASADGLLLFRRAWLPEHPERAIALVHGFGEHSGRYDELGAWFAARGCAVLAFDLRGHGRSQGRRTHVDSFAEYLDDVDLLMAAARQEHGGLPLLLLGHSMGGLIAVSYLQERQPTIAGAVISAPALSVPGGPRAALARIARRVLPRLPIAAGLDLAGLSRDPEVVRRYEADPLVERRLSVSLAAELFAAAPRAGTRGAEIRVPTLFLHGQQDPLCAPEATRALAEQVTVSGSRLLEYPLLRHEAFNEPEREQVFADVWRWVQELAR
jgi:alpha-beta hydrolase superfamily lysophospholipase